MIKKYVTLMPLVASTLFGAMNPRALSDIYMDLPQLCDTAEIIVFGEITDIEYTIDDESKTPRTLISVKPISFIKDIRDESPARHIVVTVLGGMVGSKFWSLQGLSEFRLGENVILFLLTESESNNVCIIGARQGGIQRVTDNYINERQESLSEYIQLLTRLVEDN